MRKFAWKNVRHLNKDDQNETMSLLEFTGEGVLFWASIRLFPTDKEQYEFVAFDANRRLKMSTPNADSVEEAQEAVIEFLKENGIISEEDVVQDARLD
jgi:hypothetical protein